MSQADLRVTRRQRDVLSEIARLETAGEPVTTGRLSETLSMPRQNVRMYALALRTRGLVRYDASERHTAIIRMTEQGSALLGLPAPTLSLPIVGHVAAGQPGHAEQHIEGHAACLQDILEIHPGDFLLRVRGESMLGVGIYEGDLVVIRPMQEEPLGGEIVLVTIPREDCATLKRWRRNNGTVTLLSENPAYSPMSFPAQDVLVQGCLVGHVGTGRSRQTRFTTP